MLKINILFLTLFKETFETGFHYPRNEMLEVIHILWAEYSRSQKSSRDVQPLKNWGRKF